MSLDPTAEQQQAIDLFKTGGSLAIEAGAGTGKTSTLVMIAKAAGNQDGQYVAFNKALVEESRGKFPLTVGCNTAHSLAFRAGVGRLFNPDRLKSGSRMRSNDMAKQMGLGYLEATTFDGHPKTLYPGFQASLAAKTVTQFCQSKDGVIHRGHVPWQKGLDPASRAMLADVVVPAAQQLWADVQKPYGWAPFKHEHYLKMWQLNDPYIRADYILFDESQDANPVIAAIVAEQADHAQLVYVGDSQQEIYAWTGAVNALAQVETKHRTFLTQSFRFGQAIADRANLVLDTLEAPLRLSGNPAIDSTLEKLDTPKAILVRTNSMGVTQLLGLQKQGRLAHLIGGSTDLIAFAQAAQELQETGRTIHPELQLFDSWAAVQHYVNDQDEAGEDLKKMVKLIDEFGSKDIIDGLNAMPSEERAEVIVSTAHKSKGREWWSVKLANDFPQTADSTSADLRLLYVALTRAQKTLDMTALDGDGQEGEDDGDV